MPSTTDYTKQQLGVFALFKGTPNSAKSTCALSFPDAYVFDFDQKMPAISMKHFPDKKVDWDVFSDVFELSRKIDEFKINCPYETLIIDSITSLSTLALNSVGLTKKETVITMMERSREKGKSKKPGEQAVDVMGIDYYNAEANFFERYFMDEMKYLWSRPGNPKNVIVLAHIIKTESGPDLKTGIVTTTKRIVTAGRKTAAFIPARFDEDYTFTIERNSFSSEAPKRVMYSVPFMDDDSRTALNLPEKIDFTNKNFYDLYKEYLKT